MIAIFVNTYLSDQNIFKDPYISELFGEIEARIRNAGYYAIIRTVQDSEYVSNILKNWNIDGAIFLSWESESIMNEILNHNQCPIIFIDSFNSNHEKALMVNVDDYKGGYIATKYLISNGHKKIAFAGCYSRGNSIIADRFRGYKDALRDAHLPFDDRYLINTFTRYEDGLDLGRRLANHEFDVSAVFATADLLAIGIIEGARLNGCIVPHDLSIIGFDNLEISSLVTPKLTTVSQDVPKKAESAVTLLLDAIKEKEVMTNCITCDVELKVRQTVQDINFI